MKNFSGASCYPLERHTKTLVIGILPWWQRWSLEQAALLIRG